MTVTYNPQIVTDSLALCVDPANAKSYSPNVVPFPTDIFAWCGTATVNTGSTSRDTTTSRSPVGGVPFKLTATGTDAYVATYNQSAWNLAPAANGQTWTISFWAKASSTATAEPYLFSANSSGAYLEAPSSLFTVTTFWQRFSFSTTFSNASTAFVQARLGNRTNGSTIWFDGLQVERAASASNFSPQTNINGNTIYNAAVVSVTSTTTSSISGVDILVIGGGGAGGHLGGGGAGGHRYFTNESLVANTNYTVTVGLGGAASTGATGNQGLNSVFNTYTSAGGGGGAGEASLPAAGGSGGGGGGSLVLPRPGAAGNTPNTSPSQGNAGGSGNDNGAGTAFAGGGGGGAGSTGGTASTSTTAGNGGTGTATTITGSSVTRAAGGGGGAYQLSATGTAGAGGSSIGGNGGRNGLNATPGSPNTGSGGGGNGYTSAGNLQGSSGAGGSGVIILRYPNTFSISNPGGGLTFTTDSASVAGYNITTFTVGTGTVALTSIIANTAVVTTGILTPTTLPPTLSYSPARLVYNGSNNYISFGNVLNTTNTGLSCFAWVNHNSIGTNWGPIFSKRDGAGIGWHLSINSSGTAVLFGYDNVSITGSVSLVSNTWYYIGFTFAGNGAILLYANGIQITNNNFTLTANNISFEIGRFNQSLTFPGSISHAIAYTKVLSASEITQNFNATRSRYGI